MKACKLLIALMLVTITSVSAQQQDSVINLDSSLKKIAKADYERYRKAYTAAGTNASLRHLGLRLRSDCGDICQDFLIENKTGKKILLGADFDAGLLGLIISPSHKTLITYSSYDGPDYVEYYKYRARIMSYRIGPGTGLKTVRYKQDYAFDNWSISEIIWIDSKSIALKMYRGSYVGKQHYKYFKKTL